MRTKRCKCFEINISIKKVKSKKVEVFYISTFFIKKIIKFAIMVIVWDIGGSLDVYSKK